MACVKIFFRYWALPDWLMVTFILGFSAIYFYVVHVKYKTNKTDADSTLGILFITGAIYLVFSSINFFTNRYILLLTPFMILYFTYYISQSLQIRKYVPVTWIVIILLIFVYKGMNDTSTIDDSPKYICAVKLEQLVVDYMEDQKLQDKNIHCTFLFKIALDQPAAGYLFPGNKTFKLASAEFNKKTEYLIVSNVDPDPLEETIKNQLSDFKLVKVFDSGIAHGMLYKRV